MIEHLGMRGGEGVVGDEIIGPEFDPGAGVALGGGEVVTREGLDMGSGLYFYVLTATGSAGKDQVQRGKFVIIR